MEPPGLIGLACRDNPRTWPIEGQLFARSIVDLIASAFLAGRYQERLAAPASAMRPTPKVASDLGVDAYFLKTVSLGRIAAEIRRLRRHAG